MRQAEIKTHLRMMAFLLTLTCFMLLVGCNAAEATAVATFTSLQDKVRTMCSASAVEAKSKEPYRIGKVLVASDAGQVDGWAMSDRDLVGIVATTPEVVGTLVCVGEAEKSLDSTFKYGDGTLAYRQKRSVRVIDFTTGEVLYREALFGGPPPYYLKNDINYGDDPIGFKLHDFIEHLKEN